MQNDESFFKLRVSVVVSKQCGTLLTLVFFIAYIFVWCICLACWRVQSLFSHFMSSTHPFSYTMTTFWLKKRSLEHNVVSVEICWAGIEILICVLLSTFKDKVGSWKLPWYHRLIVISTKATVSSSAVWNVHLYKVLHLKSRIMRETVVIITDWMWTRGTRDELRKVCSTSRMLPYLFAVKLLLHQSFVLYYCAKDLV